MSFRMSEGDWVCDDPICGNINFARRLACNRCQRERSDLKAKKRKLGIEIGKSAAEKSGGLFSADDWQCTKCGNVNWARRSTCNVCNAPKFTEVEERTGVGGGYNERGTVEYKPRVDSDDEYDEFGRRKKRKHEPAMKDAIESTNGQKSKDKSTDNKSGEGNCDTNDGQGAANVKTISPVKEFDKVNEVDGDDDDEDDDDDDDEEEDLSKYDLTDV